MTLASGWSVFGVGFLSGNCRSVDGLSVGHHRTSLPESKMQGCWALRGLGAQDSGFMVSGV